MQEEQEEQIPTMTIILPSSSYILHVRLFAIISLNTKNHRAREPRTGVLRAQLPDLGHGWR